MAVEEKQEYPFGTKSIPAVIPMTTTTLRHAFSLTIDLKWRGTKNEVQACACLVHVAEALGWSYDLKRMKQQDVDGMVRSWRLRGLSNGTINRRISALNVVSSTLARSLGYAFVPAGGLLKEAPARTRLVTDDELRWMQQAMGLWSSLDEFVLLLRYSGLRVSEALALAVSDIVWTADPSNKLMGAYTLTVRESKNGSPRSVPVPADKCGAFLGSRRSIAPPDERLFAFTQGEFNRRWDRGRRTMGLAGDDQFVPHALRHTRATELVRAGVPLPAVQKIMGHKSIQTTLRYTHLSDGDVRQAMEEKGLL